MGFENSAGIDVFNHYGTRESEVGNMGARTTKTGEREMKTYLDPATLAGGFLQEHNIPAGSVVQSVILKLEEAFVVSASTSFVLGDDATNGVNVLEADLEAAPGIYDITATGTIGDYDTGINTASTPAWFTAVGGVTDATVGRAELVVTYVVV